MSGLGGKTLGILAGTRAEELYLRHKVVLRTDNHIVIISCIFSLFYNDSKSPGTPFFSFPSPCFSSVLPRKFWTTRLFFYLSAFLQFAIPAQNFCNGFWNDHDLASATGRSLAWICNCISLQRNIWKTIRMTVMYIRHFAFIFFQSKQKYFWVWRIHVFVSFSLKIAMVYPIKSCISQ